MLAPALIAAYFVLALAAASGNESHPLIDVVGPLAVSLAVALVAWLLARGLVGDRSKATVLAYVVMMGFGLFGYLVQVAAQQRGADEWVVAPWVLLGTVCVISFAAFIVRRSRRQFHVAAQFVLIMSSLLAGFAAIRMGLQALGDQGDSISPAHSTRPAPRRPTSRRPPDIYLLLLDKYTSSSELAATYGLDNTPFEDTLRRRGLRVPRAPRANYVHTFLALAAMLNLRYLDELPAQVGIDEWSRRPVDPLIEHNRFMAVLKAQGYRIVFFPTSYPATRRNRDADLQIPPPEQVRSEFVTGWLWTTPIPAVVEFACRVIGCVLDPVRYVPESAEFMDWKFSQLERLAGGDQPMFAFVHLMLPHEPYIYDADCRHRTPYYPNTNTAAELPRVKAAYTDQIRCLNRKLVHLVSILQERSSTPPVILLQSDHGHGLFGRHLPAFELASPAQRAERASVFAAYALPGARAEMLPDSVTPINVMRFILREYFGENLPPLEDATYWSSDRQPYRLVRMSKDGRPSRVRRSAAGRSPPHLCRVPKVRDARRHGSALSRTSATLWAR